MNWTFDGDELGSKREQERLAWIQGQLSNSHFAYPSLDGFRPGWYLYFGGVSFLLCALAVIGMGILELLFLGLLLIRLLH